MSGRDRPVENSLLTKHVVAAGNFAKDAGSTPAASTILFCRHLCARQAGTYNATNKGALMFTGFLKVAESPGNGLRWGARNSVEESGKWRKTGG